ncbi:MAG: hypothetical protein ABIN91_20635 [Mucilaginibacter sp.]|uniref:hypothetical protein n=1 Tax=Mucilaginibacter sp. TaxID=1882438 RepID=UPI0032670782
MKRIFALAIAILLFSSAFAQKKKAAKKEHADDAPKEVVKKELPQPFKGGVDSLLLFFKDNLIVTPAIVKAKASGSAIIKFTADNEGFLTSIVVYYADDYILTQPATDALRRTNGKWVIPKEVESYDFVIQFTYNYKPAGAIKPAAMKAILDFHQKHVPIIAHDQVPLNYATLLPTIIVDYN